MTAASMPDFGKAPTFDDVVAYAVSSNLFGKVSLTKFFEYYGNFSGPGGSIIDWKTKLHEWANRQKSQVNVTAAEYAAKDRIAKKQKESSRYKIDGDLIRKLNADLDRWGVAY